MFDREIKYCNRPPYDVQASSFGFEATTGRMAKVER